MPFERKDAGSAHCRARKTAATEQIGAEEIRSQAMSGVHEVTAMDNVEALKSALRRPDVDVNARNRLNETALMLAGWYGRVASARILIEHGADVNAQNGRGNSAMSWAIAKGHKAMVQLLADNGADLEQKNENGQIPLDQAVTGERSEIARILQEAAEKRKKAYQTFIAGKQRRVNDLARKTKKPGGAP